MPSDVRERFLHEAVDGGLDHMGNRSVQIRGERNENIAARPRTFGEESERRRQAEIIEDRGRSSYATRRSC